MGLFDRFTRKSGAASAKAEPTAAPPKTAETATPIAKEGQPAPQPAKSEPVKAEPPPRKGFFAGIGAALQKTSRVLNTDIRDLFKQKGQLVDDEFLSRLFAILIKTDMGNGPASAIRDQIKTDFRGRVVEMHEVLTVIKAKLRELMAQPAVPIQLAQSGPTIILVVGVNGSGKTTSIAKLANLFIKQGRRVVLGAGDTYRAAAVQQLTVWAQRIGAQIVTGEAKSDPASVAHRAVAQALETQAEVCIIDTAGRLQTQTSLMQELAKIRRVIGNLVLDSPHEVLLVLDATAGQNGISQAKGFSEAAGCTGIVLAKLDGTAKGGVVVPIRQQFQLPVKYIGVGEKAEDLALFNADEFVEGMFAEAAQGK